ncbi:unnamed protein product [Spirodela intermedia]|uniref:X8 domain-containing protein n=1 Tax=Spirodela intermedia TaxID=51605 RepID=A0A7I8IU47_SPIIN|nr:unnamed protein product [Spirodela intermedia]CAA6661554.1 unnamed protein product [Spirodela intermedia]
MLAALGSSPAAADSWVAHNVSRYTVKGGVDIRYVAVGNEPFLASYQGKYQPFVLPALANLQQSLSRANLAASSSLSSLQRRRLRGPYPLAGDLPTGARSGNLGDYAFFSGSTHSVTDGQSLYSNAFDGNFDTLVAALARIGYGQLPVIVGEVGWPTEGGGGAANLSAARAFNQGLVNHILSGKGTPLRPNSPPVDVYLFSLLDEDQKNVLPGNFERHWGIFSFDGQTKYPLNLGRGKLRNAEKVNYLPARWCRACSAADCTTLLYGGSCNGIGEEGNLQRQEEKSCDFDGLGIVTFLDPSVGACRFLVGSATAAALAASVGFSAASGPCPCGRTSPSDCLVMPELVHPLELKNRVVEKLTTVFFYDYNSSGMS